MNERNSLTLEEQERILVIAESLIREPSSWKTGTWKCEIPGKSDDGNNQPLYGYCVEGAINEATLRVVGEERAIAVGAVRRDSDGYLEHNEPAVDVGFGPTQIMELDGLAFDLFAEEMGWTVRDEAMAMTYNDAMGGRNPQAAHAGVLKLIKTKLTEVRQSLGKDQRKTAA